MGFFDKLKSAIRKIKGKLLFYVLILLVIIVTGVAPLTIALKDAKTQELPNGNFNWEVFFMQLINGLPNPHIQFKNCFTDNYFSSFIYVLKPFLIVFGLAALVGVYKAFPKHEYQDIENGSSDWCEGGEQYHVLNKNKGIILAEKNYLPVDKRGNVNVLVVRRFWCW